jgi:hypothetical protein
MHAYVNIGTNQELKLAEAGRYELSESWATTWAGFTVPCSHFHEPGSLLWPQCQFSRLKKSCGEKSRGETPIELTTK